jgi:ferric-dicitrate binding protein FerR (iron transport regulator)
MNEPDEVPEDRYLWDRGGEPDPEVERLERLLARHRYDPVRDALPSALGAARLRARPRARLVTLAASIAAVLAVLVFALREREVPMYHVEGLSEIEHAGAGQSLSTGPDRSARLVIGGLGSVEVEPDSRLRIEDAGERRHELFLERGAVRASIFARPGEFRIGTPAGMSIDLGCVY